ncbi:MAG TPA: pyridoxamine 5'-phosphate oxidase family protein [Vicinamibacterales bacterium]|nr:pyridoxamine 5'-phosphate oxidase family protein [Vicinamibacterales bacterium]
MTRNELLAFMRSERYAVQASVSARGRPQAAVVGIAVSDAFEIVFDTLDSTRKAVNLRANPGVAFVIGGTGEGDERTVQYEGTADVPEGAERERLQRLYFDRFPDGKDRQAWPGLIYVRVKPSWIRYSNFNVQPPQIVEFDLSTLNAP